MSERQFKIESRYTVSEVAEYLEKHYGIISAAANEMDVGRNNLAKYLKRHPEALEAYKQSRERLVDRAENTLVRALEGFKGDPKSAIDAAKFILQYMGGAERGYSTKQQVEISGKDGTPLTLPVIIFEPAKHDMQEK